MKIAEIQGLIQVTANLDSLSGLDKGTPTRMRKAGMPEKGENTPFLISSVSNGGITATKEVANRAVHN
jgi:hypothetical protein